MAGRTGVAWIRHLDHNWRTRPMAAAVIALLVVLGMATPPASYGATEPALRIELTDVSPAVLRTADELTITGVVVNSTDTDLSAQVRLRMQRHVPVGRSALNEWNAGTSDANVLALTGWNPVTSVVPAGGSAPFTIVLPTDGTFETQSEWGPRGIEIQARSGEIETAERTSLLWYPTEVPLQAAAEVALLVPMTPTLDEWQQAMTQQLPVGEVAAPRLLELIEVVGPQASLAIDPILLDGAIPGLPHDDGTGSLADSHLQLIEQLADPRTHRDLIALGYADPALSTVASLEAEPLWLEAQQHGQELLAEAGLRIEDMAWPAGAVSAGALAILARRSTDAVILDQDNLTTSIATEPHAVATAGSISVDALIADTGLSAALIDPTTGVQARQATLALSAVATRGLPSEPAGFLLTLPRDTTGIDLAQLGSQIEAFNSAPWLEPASLRALLGRSATGPSIALPTLEPEPGSLGQEQLTELQAHRELLASYAQAAGTTVTNQYLPGMLMPLSATLNADPAMREQLLEATAASAQELESSISVAAGSDVLLISGTGSMPITITNELPAPASVYIELVPTGAQLQVPEIPRVELPAESSTTVRIPINAVGNGNVPVNVRILPSVNGEDLAPPTSFAVRVRADWENIGTAIIAALLGVAFIVGLVRTIRRGVRRDGSSTPPTTTREGSR
ncbi:MAG: DUF6049 family protein [Beutenbergiaceae bacterium]